MYVFYGRYVEETKKYNKKVFFPLFRDTRRLI